MKNPRLGRGFFIVVIGTKENLPSKGRLYNN